MLTVLWNVTPCSNVERYQHFRIVHGLHLQGKSVKHTRKLRYICIKRRKGYRTVSGVVGYGNHPFKGHCLPLAHDSALGRIHSKWSKILYTVPLTLIGSLRALAPPSISLHSYPFFPCSLYSSALKIETAVSFKSWQCLMRLYDITSKRL
jgi:hypothetical protein